MYSIELKIKRKNLADESRDIRREEKLAKAKGDRAQVNSLHSHRIGVVRPAARSAHLAHAHLTGTSYHAVEGRAKTPPNYKEVARLVRKFSGLEEFTWEDVVIWADKPSPERKAA